MITAADTNVVQTQGGIVSSYRPVTAMMFPLPITRPMRRAA
jgi:hypothetical protein